MSPTPQNTISHILNIKYVPDNIEFMQQMQLKENIANAITWSRVGTSGATMGGAQVP